MIIKQWANVPPQFRMLACTATVLSLSIVGSATHSDAQDATGQPKESPANLTDTANTETYKEQDYAGDDSPALGVMVESCPGPGVCVTDTLLDSPAASAGIEAGDYILAINDQEVSSPRNLRQTLEQLTSNDTVNVTVWRRGKTTTTQVALASEAKTLPGSHRGWLGVTLTAGSDENTDKEASVVIQRVLRNSPAAKAGLQAGDDVQKINGSEVKSLEQFVENVQDFEPGAKLALTVRRGSEEVEIPVVVGEVANAPMQWFRESFRMPMDRMPMTNDDFSMPLTPGAAVMDEMLDDMRQQIRSLQQQVNELKQPTPPPVDSSLEGSDEEPAGQPDEDDLSTLDAFADHPMILGQFNGIRGLRPNISNDWNGSRYGNRGYQWRDDRYDGRYRSNYWNSNRSNYPYRYYNRGGRPQYYGGGNPYGFQGGIQIGRNFGIRW